MVVTGIGHRPGTRTVRSDRPEQEVGDGGALGVEFVGGEPDPVLGEVTVVEAGHHLPGLAVAGDREAEDETFGGSVLAVGDDGQRDAVTRWRWG